MKVWQRIPGHPGREFLIEEVSIPKTIIYHPQIGYWTYQDTQKAFTTANSYVRCPLNFDSAPFQANQQQRFLPFQYNIRVKAQKTGGDKEICLRAKLNLGFSLENCIESVIITTTVSEYVFTIFVDSEIWINPTGYYVDFLIEGQGGGSDASGLLYFDSTTTVSYPRKVISTEKYPFPAITGQFWLKHFFFQTNYNPDQNSPYYYPNYAPVKIPTDRVWLNTNNSRLPGRHRFGGDEGFYALSTYPLDLRSMFQIPFRFYGDPLTELELELVTTNDHFALYCYASEHNSDISPFKLLEGWASNDETDALTLTSSDPTIIYQAVSTKYRLTFETLYAGAIFVGVGCKWGTIDPGLTYKSVWLSFDIGIFRNATQTIDVIGTSEFKALPQEQTYTKLACFIQEQHMQPEDRLAFRLYAKAGEEAGEWPPIELNKRPAWFQIPLHRSIITTTTLILIHDSRPLGGPTK
jgi:hypothetical protein